MVYYPPLNPKPPKSEEHIKKLIQEVEGSDHHNFRRSVRIILWSAVITIIIACLSFKARASTLPGDSAYCPMCHQYMPMDHLNVRVGMGFLGIVDGRYVMTYLGYWLMEHDGGTSLPIDIMPDSAKALFPPGFLTNRYIRAKWQDRIRKTEYKNLWRGN